ncbi:unnamed protein product [Oppiella nova]|uniref:C2H2-type domain-containing protein n=1 Tax=Oppiella nova TaxID=334625 RepID=A0A7R9MM70_9ACAR|nr:unnamed protein product [Oppiella nova]CAG2179992.1 unnamed protein product [Oppiella nova]
MESFDIEEGVEQELSTASLLVLYVIYKFSVCFPHIVMYFNDNWHQLQEFNTRLDQMLKMDKIVQLLRQQIGDNRTTDAVGSGGDNENTNCSNKTNVQTVDTINDNQITTEVMEPLVETLDDRISESNSGMSTTTYPTLHLKPNTVHTYASLASTSAATAAEELIVPHLLHNNSNTASEPSSHSPSPTGQTFVCLYCHRVFASKYKLKRHEFVHKPLSKPFKCPWSECDLRFRSSFDMRRHLVTHTGERPFGCDQCGKRFSRADKLKEHKLIHVKRCQRMAKQFMLQHQQQYNNSDQHFPMAAHESPSMIGLDHTSGDDLSALDTSLLFDNQLVANIKTELNVL